MVFLFGMSVHINAETEYVIDANQACLNNAWNTAEAVIAAGGYDGWDAWDVLDSLASQC